MLENDAKIKSLYKALNVLDCFIQDKELGVSEIGVRLGLYKSNVFCILDTFRMCGYLVQDEKTGRYRLGDKIFELSKAISDRYDLRQIALPFMQEISNKLRERVYLAIPHGDEVMYLEATYPVGEFSLMRSIVGEHAKMYCTGIGKAIMAYLPHFMKMEYTSGNLEKYTDNTITDAHQLMQELEIIKTRGYSIDDMEHEYGVKCVGFPLLDNHGQICGAISVSGPSLRFEEDRIKEIVQVVNDYIPYIQKQL